MKENEFKLLMQSLNEAKKHAKGDKVKTKVMKWEIADVSTFSNRQVQKIRHKIGVSQPLFAQLLGVSVKTVRSWEQGIATPSGSSCRLLDLFDKSKDEALSLYHNIKVIHLLR